MSKKKVARIVRWLFFSVVLSLFPLLGSYLGQAGTTRAPGFSNFLGDGSLLLIAATLAGSCVGELIGAIRRHESGIVIAVGGVAIFDALVSACCYTWISIALADGNPVHVRFIAWVSGILFVLSAVAGGCCMGLTEEVAADG